ncbi:MAG TPA: ribose-phosphate pyrophosphokinase [Candidatus Hydrogenedentes bacterium]|nr:ribose-phosphate pyrophosphokinase [Candidatus Hydrogenedentota bacterium]HIJ73684.1 ribose-phosphate pyrophosphokinase [Candidatus Hydrogenedentota bacterium]
MVVFGGTASSALSEGICAHLDIELGNATLTRFSDGEIHAQIGENVRGKDVFVINATAPPVNDNLMELLILIDAAKRASAARVTAVLPYFGYARQDRKDKPRVPITAKLVSNLLVAARVDRILTVDLHCDQIQGFFDIPLDHLRADIVFTNYLRENSVTNLVVVSPDPGSVARAREVANRLETPLAIVDKRRPRENVAEVMNIIGEVQGKHALIFDDMIDTAGTLVKAARAVKEKGAVDVKACATHAVFSGSAIDLIAESVLDAVIVSNSIPLASRNAACPKIKVLSLAPLIGEAIRRIHEEKSISILFQN